MRRRSRFVGRPPSPPSWRASRRSCAWRSRASRLSGVSSYSFAASLAGPRRAAIRCTSTSMRTGPVRSSSRSPEPTSLLGLAATPFTFTRPAFTASAASARVFTRRAAHSHLSTRMRVSACIALSGLRGLLVGPDLLELALLQPLAQHLLVELADARLRDLLDEREGLGDPPLRDSALEVLPQLLRSHVPAFADDDARERALRPLLVRTRDHGSLEHRIVCDQRLFQLDRGDPLAARLDHVLRAIGDAHVAALVDRADVARAQPAVVELLGRTRILVVITRDPRAPRLELARRLPVPVALAAVVGDQPGLHERQQSASRRSISPHLVAALLHAGRWPRDRTDRRGLGHPPALDHVDAVALLQPLHEALRDGRPATHHHAQARRVDLVLVEVLEYRAPDRRHARRAGDLLGLDQVRDWLPPPGVVTDSERCARPPA